MLNLPNILRETPYPGRGIALGITPDGMQAVIVYFIMGRSENSRNRVFIPTEDGIRTQAFDEGKLTDPSLIIYHPIRTVNGQTIVTNGDQTDTIYKHLDSPRPATANVIAQHAVSAFAAALRTRTFEPDAPHYTSRISGLLQADGRAVLSILKTADGETCRRFFYEYEPRAGLGHFIHTYQADKEPLPPFEGEPRPIAIKQDVNAFAGEIWQSLNTENKVALFVRSVHLESEEQETRIYNRHDN